MKLMKKLLLSESGELTVMKQVAFAIVITYCALFGIAERAQAATLQELFDGASISALDKDFSDWEQSFIAGPGIDPSKIEVTALEDNPLNPGLLFTAEPGGIIGDGADGESSRILFNYTVTSNGNPIDGNELELIDFSIEGELGPITTISIGEFVKDVNDNDIGNKEVGVTQFTEVLFDDLDFEVPQQSIVVDTFIQVDGRQSAIAQINQYSQRFSQVPIPAAVWLLGGGLIGLLGLRRKFKK